MSYDEHGATTMTDRFYVYVIYDPWSGRAIYVGKGQGRRAREHLVQ